MIHEKIIKREDGSEVWVYVTLSVSDKAFWDISVWRKTKRMKAFKNVVDIDSVSYRLKHSRESYQKEMILAALSKEEMLEIKMELWNKLKPTL